MGMMPVGSILLTRELRSELPLVTSPFWSMHVFPSHGKYPLTIKILHTVVMDVRCELTV